MIIVKVIGGLGNQMYQYAFYYSLKKKYNDVKIDITDFFGYGLHNGYELEKKFDIEVEKASFYEILKVREENKRDVFHKIKRRIFGKKASHVMEKDFTFDILQSRKDLYLDGYWQSEIFFKEYEDEIKKAFTYKEKLSKKNIEIINKMKNENAVSIHVRRGDYANNSVYYQCDEDYYNNAIKYLKNKIGNIVLYVFSDDIEWVKENIKFDGYVYFIDHNNGYESYNDMRLMSHCKHNIIANSTFSWWGAWLNNNEDKMVIAPKRWFADSKKENESKIVPKSWLRR